MKARKILSMILVLTMIFSTMSIVVLAEENATTCTCSTDTTWDGTSICEHWFYNAPQGTTVFEIDTAAELAGFASLVNVPRKDTKLNGSHTVKLMADIDLNNNEWTPIGNIESYLGSFDGGNHIISNLKITQHTGNATKCAGFFAYVTNYTSEIKNFTIHNAIVTVPTKERVAVVIGNAPKATVKNVKVTGNVEVKGLHYTGAIVGHGYPIIEDCSVEANGVIESVDFTAGGIIGILGAASGTYTPSLKDCSVIGTDGSLEIKAVNGIVAAVCGNNVGTDTPMENLYAENVAVSIVNGSSSSNFVVGRNTAKDSSYKDVTLTVSGEIVDNVTSGAEAKINDVYYSSLSAAINNAAAGDTVTLIADCEDTTGVIIDKDLTLDLNNFKYSSTGSSASSSRNIRIVDDANVIIKNGTLVGQGAMVDHTVYGANAGTGAYGTIRMESTGSLEMTNVNLYNYRPWGFNVKILSGTNTFNNVKVFGSFGGGFEVNGGETTLNNCEVNVEGVYTAQASASAAFGVAGGATLNIYGGSYTTIPAGESDNGRGSYCGGVMSSGGTLNIYDGTFTNGCIDNYPLTGPAYTVLYNDAESGVVSNANIYGGTFTAFEGSSINQWNSIAGGSLPKTTLYGGYYNVDPIGSMGSIVSAGDGYKLTQYSDGTYTVVDAAYIGNDEIEVTLKEASVSEGEIVYDIVLTAAESKVINRLNSADLTFILTQVNGSNEYEIIASNDEVTINNVEGNRYEFHYADKDDDVDSDTAASIKIGQVKFTGYGTFDFAVDTSANGTNAVHATKILDSIVDTYIPTGNITAGEGLLTLVNAKTGELTIEVPTRALEVEIDFNNAVNKQVADYQDMTVIVSGGDLPANIEIELGNVNYTEDVEIFGKSNAEYSVVADADNKYTVNVTGALSVNRTYTVTVKGAGYRTVRKNITMAEDKTVANKLNFWNNVKDAEGADYLAGDIVKDNTINVYDLSAVVSYFGTINNVTIESTYAKYDLNRDGKVDSKDVAYVLVSWGK